MVRKNGQDGRFEKKKKRISNVEQGISKDEGKIRHYRGWEKILLR
jgi:hypothetical protein